MNESNNQFLTRRNIIAVILLVIIIIAIPITVYLVQQQQRLKSKATAGNEITFAGTGVDCTVEPCKTTSASIDISFHSPYGVYGAPSATPTPTPPPPVSWSENLVPSAWSNIAFKSTPAGAEQILGPGTYTLSGTILAHPVVQENPTLAAIQVDVWSGSTYVAYHPYNPNGPITFTIVVGQTGHLILRAINTDAVFNVSLTEFTSSVNLSTFPKDAAYKDTPTGTEYIFGPGTYTLSGTILAHPVVQENPTLAAIQVDVWSGSTYVAYHPYDPNGPVTFTIPTGQTGHLILRAINTDAVFSNVVLKKQL